nr:hypothetical protein L203_05884 [Cryptococcus depauperatus CBS 7841]
MTGIDIVTTCSPIPLDVSIYALTDSMLVLYSVGSDPRTSVKDFPWNGIAWFGIPLGIATSLGSSAVALIHEDTSYVSLTSDKVGAGLSAIKVASALMGKSGATIMLILLFLAVTSGISTEQITVSFILIYDVYDTYSRKIPTEKEILCVSRCCILGYALSMSTIATTFNYIGIGMGWLYRLMGTIIGYDVVPIAPRNTWQGCNGLEVVIAAVLVFFAGVSGCLGTTSTLNQGVINLTATFGDYEMLTGNSLSIGVGGVATKEDKTITEDSSPATTLLEYDQEKNGSQKEQLANEGYQYDLETVRTRKKTVEE